jgi:hypothetical protein
MDGQASNVVWMSLKLDDLFVGIVIKDPQLKVIASSDEPILPRDESDATDGHLRDFKRFDDGGCEVVVDLD